MLTHLTAQLSHDRKLLNILNSGGDIFNLMALEMDNKKYRNENDVTKEDRQKAKGICYGGMCFRFSPGHGSLCHIGFPSTSFVRSKLQIGRRIAGEHD